MREAQQTVRNSAGSQFQNHVCIRYLFRCFLCFFLAMSGGGCSAQIRFEKRDLVIVSSSGKISVKAEIARSEEQHRRGLMFREKLADGEGMLFIFERDQVLSFWMKDTLIPLSVAFIASDGKILEIHDMREKDLSSVMSSRSARYALEVPQGWFNRVGIRIGDQLVLENF